jgi:hypothetical protein
MSRSFTPDSLLVAAITPIATAAAISTKAISAPIPRSGRVVALEQLFRAANILAREPYHC